GAMAGAMAATTNTSTTMASPVMPFGLTASSVKKRRPTEAGIGGAVPASGSRSTAHIADSRIGGAVEHVHDQVDQQEEHTGQQHHGLDHRIVAPENSLDR